jgi:hypothetical protein
MGEFIGAVVFWLTLLSIPIGCAATLNIFRGKEVCTEFAIVKSVGGCDSDGLCGAQTDKGYKVLRRPVVGQKICIKREEL